MLQDIKELVPYAWRKNVLDLVRPERPGIGPVLRRMNRDMSVVFDIGANVGDISQLMLHYFPKALIYSFEPCLDTYSQLVSNIAKTGHSNRSRPFRLGFFDEEKEATLNITSFHGANSMLDITAEYQKLHPHIEKVNTEQITLVRLDDFVSQHNIGHIDLVKIDVEGVELQILKGGPKTFSTSVDTVIMEMSFLRNPRDEGEYIKLFQVMHEYGFAPAEIYDVAHAEEANTWKLAQFDCVFKRF